jgi:hypothetical protein
MSTIFRYLHKLQYLKPTIKVSSKLLSCPHMKCRSSTPRCLLAAPPRPFSVALCCKRLGIQTWQEPDPNIPNKHRTSEVDYPLQLLMHMSLQRTACPAWDLAISTTLQAGLQINKRWGGLHQKASNHSCSYHVDPTDSHVIQAAYQAK